MRIARGRSLLVLITLLLFGTARAGAQGAAPSVPAAHTHIAPHGGTIAEVAEHHIEFKADSSGTIQVWLLDGKQHLMAAPMGAGITLIGPGETQVKLALQIDASSHRLVAHFDPKKFASFQAVVTMPIDGKPHNVRFRYPSH